MATVHDVAAYILHKQGAVSAMKLQKLVYYAQAWALVWDEKPLFRARIEAWASGPVCPTLYRHHRGEFLLRTWQWGNPEALTDVERDTVDAVLEFYGDKDPQWLSDLTHAEAPWGNARRGLPVGARSDAEITPAAMAEYYGALPPPA
jgi:uncharacterized phage-associated protein